MENIFAISRPILLKTLYMNRGRFLYTLAKRHWKMVEKTRHSEIVR